MDDMQKLQKLLDECEVPEQKRTDLNWLARNLLINNQNDDGWAAHQQVLKILRGE